MPTVYDLTREQLTDRMVAWGRPAYRAKQIWRQLWKRAATYEDMADVPGPLRQRLTIELPLVVEVLTERTADRGATRKALLRLNGEHDVETVLMGYPDRVTVCVSSQAVWARREAAKLPATTPQRLTNIVFMGMGDPVEGRYPLPVRTTGAGFRWQWYLRRWDRAPARGLRYG